MKFVAVLTAAEVLFTAVLAHPGGHHIPRAEIQRRADLSKRSLDLDGRASNATYQPAADAPYYELLQNDTCVLSPDVTHGPYLWNRAQSLRQDMSEDQPGVPVWLDIDLLDMAACEPLENALVNFWHCNATGSHSSFTGLDPNTGFKDYLHQENIIWRGSGTMNNN